MMFQSWKLKEERICQQEATIQTERTTSKKNRSLRNFLIRFMLLENSQNIMKLTI